MSNKSLITLFLFAALAVFIACSDNLFGSGSSGGGSDIKSLRIDAENAFRDGKYQKSFSLCSAMVAKDSTVSFGYFGMAKAGLWERGINPLEIFSLLKTEDEDEIPFTKKDSYTQSKYLQGMKKVALALAPLDRRDSLTRLYERYKKNPMDADSSVIAFKDAFCSAGSCRDTVSGKEFPLSDREYTGDYFGPILFIASTLKGILEFYDTDNDGCIIKRADKDSLALDKWKKLSCSNEADICVELKKKGDDFAIELCNILDDLGLDSAWYANQNKDTPMPDGIKNMNGKMDSFTGDMDEVLSIMGSLGMGGASGDWTGDVDLYKDYARFYRIGTRIDETGDGCIEAQLLDGQDNLGEGLKNASARIASIDSTSSLWGRSGINHSMYGDPENPSDINNPRNLPMLVKAPAYIRNRKGANCAASPADCTLLPGDSTGTGYATVIRFTQEPGYWTSKNLALKLEVAKDTACPPKYNLASRKENIGGCWPNYDEAKFRKYWLKRGLARPEDQEGRIHPSCRNY